MSQIKISGLPEYTGNTTGVYVVMNNSGETETFKVTKETLIGASGSSGTSGSSGVNGTNGSSGTSGASGSSGSTGSGGTSGTSGSNGSSGSSGKNGGVLYQFSTTTTGPGTNTGRIRYNNSSIGSVTKIFINEEDINEDNVNSWIESWDDSTTTSNRGQITIMNNTLSELGGLFNVTGATIPQSGYYEILVQYVDGDIPSNTNSLSVMFSRTGNLGSSGTSGATGSSGTSGIDGTSGTSGVAGSAGTSGSSGTSASGGGGGITQITGVTFLSSSWSLSSSLYIYDYCNSGITTSSFVMVIPSNSSIYTVTAAQILPQTDSASGSVRLYASYLPTGNISGTINIQTIS